VRFWILHQLVSYLLVSSAILALALSEELPPVTLVLTCTAVLGSWFVTPRPDGRWGPRLWTLATLAFLAYSVLDVLLGDAALLGSGVHFLLFLIVNKLFNRRQSRDYLQLYVLSFAALIAAAALNTDLSFAFCFLLYVIFATWSLVLLHLRREMEENYLLRHTDPDLAAKRVEVHRILHSKRIVSGRFLLATSLLSLSIFLASTLLFLLFPRVGFGFLFGRSRLGVSMAGFSEQIELGSFGRIKDNPAVVLRVELPDHPQRDRLAWRWRGISFDRYDGYAWRKDRTGWKQLQRGRAPRLFLVDPKANLGRAFRAQVYQEPVSDTNVLFSPGRPLAVQLPEKRTYSAGDPRYVRRDLHGDLSLDGDPSLSISYLLYFVDEPPSPAILKALDRPDPRSITQRYLQLPPLSPRVKALAEEVTRGLISRYDRVVAIEQHLRRNYRYTVDLRRNEALSPLDDFLFEQRAGHCEYFSTAMVILLRSLGIPARNINGFLGGEWNPYGRYYTVRQGDAHSWVEVYFEGAGWIPFDPTPPQIRGGPRESGFFAAIAAFIDSLRLKWNKWVVEYDLAKQVGLFQKISAWFRNLFSQSGLSELGRDLRDFLGSAWGVALGAGLGGLVVLFFIRRRRKRPAARGQDQGRQREITRLYLDLLQALRSRGIEKPPFQTPRGFARALAQARLDLAPTVSLVTEVYNAVRFGGRPLDSAELHRIRSLIRELAEKRR
jgi:transglutaminase-like putative cysteine protease